jgi:hypothetical protein
MDLPDLDALVAPTAAGDIAVLTGADLRATVAQGAGPLLPAGHPDGRNGLFALERGVVIV